MQMRTSDSWSICSQQILTRLLLLLSQYMQRSNLFSKYWHQQHITICEHHSANFPATEIMNSLAKIVAKLLPFVTPNLLQNRAYETLFLVQHCILFKTLLLKKTFLQNFISRRRSARAPKIIGSSCIFGGLSRPNLLGEFLACVQIELANYQLLSCIYLHFLGIKKATVGSLYCIGIWSDSISNFSVNIKNIFVVRFCIIGPFLWCDLRPIIVFLAAWSCESWPNMSPSKN
jgi:hypothetical protein